MTENPSAWDDHRWIVATVATPRVVLGTALLGLLAAAGQLAELRAETFAAEILDIGRRFAELTGLPMPELPDALAQLPPPPPLERATAPQED